MDAEQPRQRPADMDDNAYWIVPPPAAAPESSEDGVGVIDVAVHVLVWRIGPIDTVASTCDISISVLYEWTDPRLVGWSGELPKKLWGPRMYLSNMMGEINEKRPFFQLIDPEVGRLRRGISFIVRCSLSLSRSLAPRSLTHANSQPGSQPGSSRIAKDSAGGCSVCARLRAGSRRQPDEFAGLSVRPAGGGDRACLEPAVCDGRRHWWHRGGRAIAVQPAARRRSDRCGKRPFRAILH
jgi:hypothetical protein